jgi:EAL domain-containing protein (putative c-di-GMP-specific phosphodiesterase class I)
MDLPTATPSQDIGARHRRRVRATLWFGAVFLSLQGIGWATFFVIRGVWPLVLIDLAVLLVGLGIGVLTHRRRTRFAFYLFLFGGYSVVCWSSLINDIPSAQVPRATHLYLLVLGLAANLFLRDDPPWLRRSAVGTFLATFVVLASTNWGWATPYAMPDSVRVIGTWVHTVLAVIAMYILMQVMVSDLIENSSLEAELRRGIERGEFFLLYQAQVTSDGTVTGAEALLRWRHPKRGLVSPGEFISVAEQTGLIVPLGNWVLSTACTQLAEWATRPDMDTMTLSINVSAQQFSQPNFVQQVQDATRLTGANPQRLKVELTESMLAHDIEDIIQKMHSLKTIGVGTSLDDFGTGFSSLSYLKRMPLDQLKIDQSFVRDVLSNDNDASIAKTIINLGKDLHFTVIAEGVETTGQRDFLMQNGCHRFQGYLYSKPIPAAAFLQFCDQAANPSSRA